MPLDPVLIAFGVRTTKTGRNIWKQVGEVYPHENGAGLTLVLNVMPLDGRIIMLERDERDDARLQAEAARMAKMKQGREAPWAMR